MIRFLGILILYGFSADALFADDSLKCSGSYTKDSLKNGVWLCRKGERIVRKERYLKGTLSTYIVYDEKGQIIETRNKKGRVKTYKPCGCK